MALDIKSLPENVQEYLEEAKKVFSREKYEQKYKEIESIFSNFPEHMLNNLHFIKSPQEELEQDSQNAKDDAESKSSKSIVEILTNQYDDDLELWFDLSEAVNSKELQYGYQALNEDERLIFLVDGFEREINNGGLLQLFSNSIGARSDELLEALKELELDKTYDLLSQAMGVFEPKAEHSKNIEIESNLSKGQRIKLEEIEKVYFDDYQDLIGKVIEHLRHRDTN